LPKSNFIVSFASVYIDESDSHAGASTLCIAGFLFETDRAELLDAEWRQVLEREGMPYMRMSQFTKGGQKPYEHLSRARRIEIQKELIAIIRRHRSFSFLCGIDERMFDHVLGECFPSAPYYERPISAYAWSLVDCQRLVRMWALDHRFDGKIAYFFEAGHKNQGEANSIWNSVFSTDERRRILHYGSHSFIGKQDAGGKDSVNRVVSPRV
jgi:hypothetical protein